MCSVTGGKLVQAQSQVQQVIEFTAQMPSQLSRHSVHVALVHVPQGGQHGCGEKKLPRHQRQDEARVDAFLREGASRQRCGADRQGQNDQEQGRRGGDAAQETDVVPQRTCQTCSERRWSSMPRIT